MSHFTKIKTKFQDGVILKKLLEAMAYNVKTHDTPVTISGYNGETEKANIVVSKDQFGGYSDLGYRKEDKAFEELIDSDDRTKVFRPCGGSNRFKMKYSTEVVLKEHNRLQGRISTTQKDMENGNILVETVAMVEN